MLAEARQKGHLQGTGGSPAKFLKQHPNIVSTLTSYWVDIQRIFSLNLLFLEAEESVLRQAQVERQGAGLLSTDSTTVSFMRLYDIPMLATNDSDFDRVAGIQVFHPTDI